MKKVLAIGALAAAILMTCSCDMFRRMAGRPTSAELEQKRVQIEEFEAAEQARIAAEMLAKQKTADSLATLDSMLNCGIPIKTTNQISPSAKSQLGHRYYVMIGAFGDGSNAAKLQKKVQDAGFEAVLIPYRNGMTGVGLCPSDDLASIYRPLMAVKQQAFCPKGVWVLDNE